MLKSARIEKENRASTLPARSVLSNSLCNLLSILESEDHRSVTVCHDHIQHRLPALLIELRNQVFSLPELCDICIDCFSFRQLFCSFPFQFFQSFRSRLIPFLIACISRQENRLQSFESQNADITETMSSHLIAYDEKDSLVARFVAGIPKMTRYSQ